MLSLGCEKLQPERLLPPGSIELKVGEALDVVCLQAEAHLGFMSMVESILASTPALPPPGGWTRLPERSGSSTPASTSRSTHVGPAGAKAPSPRPSGPLARHALVEPWNLVTAGGPSLENLFQKAFDSKETKTFRIWVFPPKKGCLG